MRHNIQKRDKQNDLQLTEKVTELNAVLSELVTLNRDDLRIAYYFEGLRQSLIGFLQREGVTDNSNAK